MDPELFEDTFYAWLEANGVTFDEPLTKPPFHCTIDLNKLKVGIVMLIDHDLAQRDAS